MKYLPWNRRDLVVSLSLVGLGFLIRFSIVNAINAWDTMAGPDSNFYLNTARSLAYGREYGTMFWPPLASFSLIPAYKFGYELKGAIFEQIILLSLTGGLIYLAARFVLGRFGSLVASLLFLGYSTMLFAYSFSILSENLYMALLTIAFIFLLLYWRTKSFQNIDQSQYKTIISTSPRPEKEFSLYSMKSFAGARAILRWIRRYRRQIWLGFSAVAFALTALTRPVVVPFVYFIAGAIWFKERRFTPTLYFLALFFIIIAPWTYRNWRNYHQFTFISNNGGYAFWAGNHFSPENNWEEYPISGKAYPELSLKSNGWYDEKAAVQIALGRIVSYPRRFIIATWHRAQTYFPANEPVYIRNPLTLPVWPFRTILVLSIIGSVVILTNWKNFSGLERFFWGIIIGYIIFHSLVHLVTITQDVRYRNVLTPLFVIVAAYPIERLFQRQRFWWPAACSLVLFMMITMSLQTEFISDLQAKGIPYWLEFAIAASGLLIFTLLALSDLKSRLTGIILASLITLFTLQHKGVFTEQHIKTLAHKRFHQVFITYAIP